MRIPKTSLDLGRVNYNRSTGRQRQQIANGLMDMYADTGNLSQILAAQVEEPWARKQQREQQDKLFEENQYNQRIEDETALQQIKMGGDADNDAFANLIRSEQEDIYEAKKLGRENPEIQHKIPRIIAEKEALVKTMIQTSTDVGVALNDLEEGMKIQPGKAGSIDVMFPDATQRVLLGIKTGETSFVNRNGQIFGVLPSLEDGGLPMAVNLSKISQDIQEGKDPIPTVPDITESLKGGYDNIFKPGGKDNAELVTFGEKRSGTQVITTKTMTAEQRQLGIEKLVKSNQFKGIIEDEDRMSKIWSNTMGKDEPWLQVPGNTREEIQANIDKQKQEAAYFLANMAVEENAAAEGILEVAGRKEYKPPSATPPPKPEDPLKVAKRIRAKEGFQHARELEGESPEVIAEYLTNINRGNTVYTVVDNDYIENHPDYDAEEKAKFMQENYTKYYKGMDTDKIAEAMIEAQKEYDAKILDYLKPGDIVDKDGNVIPVSNEEEIAKAISDEGGYSKDEYMVYRSGASSNAKKAYEALPEDKRPKPSEKYFTVDGQRYNNPVYSKNHGGKNKDNDPLDYRANQQNKED